MIKPARDIWTISSCIIALALILLPQVQNAASAATYYVAKTGNNANTCAQAQSTATPKLTIASGLTCVKADDTLYIRAGTYAENISSNEQTIPTGTSWTDAPVIAAYPGETVTMTGELQLPHAYIQYVIFRNLIFANGTITVTLGTSVNATHHVKFENVEVKLATHNCISIGHAAHHIWFTGGSAHNCANGNPTSNGGYVMYISGTDNLIENMEIYSNPWYCVHVYEPGTPKAARNIFRSNTLHNCATSSGSSAAIMLSSGDSNEAYNNILYSNSGHGIQNFSGTNAKIYNNTIYGGAQTGVQIQPLATGAVVRNNILYQNSGGALSDVGTGTIADHNLTTDPLFVNAAAFNFNLQTNSPAIDAGVTLSQVTTDFKLTPRPQGGAYDIGAYERGGSSDIEPPQRPVGLVIR